VELLESINVDGSGIVQEVAITILNGGSSNIDFACVTSRKQQL